MKKLLFLVPTYSSFYKPIKSAFEKNGWEVVTVDYRRGDPLTRARKLIAKLGLYNADFLIEKKIIRSSAKIKPDIILAIKGETLTKNLLKKLKTKKNKIVNWFPDPMSQFAIAEKIAPYYDYFFHFDSEIVKKLRRKKHNNVYCLPFGAEIIPGTQKKVYDISFIGTYSKHRERILSKLMKFDLNILGDPRWYQSSLKKFVRGGRISQSKMKNVIKQSKINLNIHNETNLGGANLRTFEVTGCCSFLLTDYTKDIGKLFTNNEEIVWYKNSNELKRIVTYYLSEEKKRRDIAVKGFLRIREKFNYNKRIKELLYIIYGQN